MKIGFLTVEYVIKNHFRGGLGNYLRRLTIALAKSGHEPHVFYYTDLPQGMQFDQGIYVHTLNNQPSKLLKQTNTVTRYRLRQTLPTLERAYRFRRYLLETAQKFPLDIIQSSNVEFPGLMAPDISPMVIRCSSYRPLIDKFDQRRINVDRRIYTRLEASQYRRAAGVFAPTKLLAKILDRELGLSNVEVIRTPFYNEVSELDHKLYNDDLKGIDYLLFFGKLTRLKGAFVLGEALPLVWRQYPNLKVVFVGEDSRVGGDSSSDLIRKNCMGYEDNLRFYPTIPHPKLYPIIQHARLVVLPTLFDNSPNTLLEAMGFGRPVVGTIGTSMDEFIEDFVSGFLVQPGNSEELAEKICEVWESKDLRQVGEAAKDVMKNLSPDQVLPQLLKFYQSHLSRPCEELSITSDA